MKKPKMAVLLAFAFTTILVWSINKNAFAGASCEHPRCHTVGDVCLPGHAISFRPDCSDDFGNLKCDLQAPCSWDLSLPDPE